MDKALLEKIQNAQREARDDARSDALEHLRAADRLTARESIQHLLDSESVIEYGALAGATSQVDDRDAAAD